MADQPPIHVDVVVIGLGYVGLQLAQGALNRGLSVTGLDLSTRCKKDAGSRLHGYEQS